MILTQRVAGVTALRTEHGNAPAMQNAIGGRFNAILRSSVKWPGMRGMTYGRYYGPAWTPFLDYWPRTAYIPQQKYVVGDVAYGKDTVGRSTVGGSNTVEVAPGVWV